MAFQNSRLFPKKKRRLVWGNAIQKTIGLSVQSMPELNAACLWEGVQKKTGMVSRSDLKKDRHGLQKRSEKRPAWSPEAI